MSHAGAYLARLPSAGPPLREELQQTGATRAQPLTTVQIPEYREEDGQKDHPVGKKSSRIRGEMVSANTASGGRDGADCRAPNRKYESTLGPIMLHHRQSRPNPRHGLSMHASRQTSPTPWPSQQGMLRTTAGHLCR